MELDLFLRGYFLMLAVVLLLGENIGNALADYKKLALAGIEFTSAAYENVLCRIDAQSAWLDTAIHKNTLYRTAHNGGGKLCKLLSLISSVAAARGQSRLSKAFQIVAVLPQRAFHPGNGIVKAVVYLQHLGEQDMADFIPCIVC